MNAAVLYLVCATMIARLAYLIAFPPAYSAAHGEPLVELPFYRVPFTLHLKSVGVTDLKPTACALDIHQRGRPVRHFRFTTNRGFYYVNDFRRAVRIRLNCPGHRVQFVDRLVSFDQLEVRTCVGAQCNTVFLYRPDRNPFDFRSQRARDHAARATAVVVLLVVMLCRCATTPRPPRILVARGQAAHPCPICLEPRTDARLLVCRHRFHRACLARWLAINPTCPTCRAPV